MVHNKTAKKMNCALNFKIESIYLSIYLAIYMYTSKNEFLYVCLSVPYAFLNSGEWTY